MKVLILATVTLEVHWLVTTMVQLKNNGNFIARTSTKTLILFQVHSICMELQVGDNIAVKRINLEYTLKLPTIESGLTKR